MKIESKAIKNSPYAKKLIEDEKFIDVGKDYLCLSHSKSFIGLKDKKNHEKISYIPKNYIVGVSLRSQRIARNTGSNQIVYVLVTGEIFIHKIEYDIKGIIIEYMTSLKEIIPQAILTNDYSMEIWRDFYKEDSSKLYGEISKEKNLISEKVDFYRLLSWDGRYSDQLKRGDRVLIEDEDGKRIEGQIKLILSGSHPNGVMVQLEGGEEGRIKRILSEIREPIQYVQTEEYDEDLEIYREIKKQEEEFNFKEPGLDPKTGKLSRALVIFFIVLIGFGVLRLLIKLI